MTDLFKAILLGAVQGVSEFLPISSTGHLILAENLLGISQETFGLAFDAALHLGTLAAILWYFRKEWSGLLGSIYRYLDISNWRGGKFDGIDYKQINKEQKSQIELVKLLIVGTIPAVIIGLLLENTVENTFRSPHLVGLMLILFSGVLFYVEKFGQRTKSITGLKIIDSVIIGFAQSIALIPGVSRSGITMAAGMQRQMNRSEAARFAFLLSAPIVAGAGGMQLINTLQLFFSQQISFEVLSFFSIGMVSAAIFGYLTIKYFLKYISTHTLYPFIIYRIILGLIVIIM